MTDTAIRDPIPINTNTQACYVQPAIPTEPFNPYSVTFPPLATPSPSEAEKSLRKAGAELMLSVALLMARIKQQYDEFPRRWT